MMGITKPAGGGGRRADTDEPALQLLDRYRGCLIGLACGDAVGTTVEFAPRDSFTPIGDMVGGGPFGLKAGQWTDDTSMALCLAESLLYRGGCHPVDQMNRYVNWWRHGYLSSTGECFDIGGTTQQALSRYVATGEPFSGSTDPRSAGNGSLMRLAPIVLFYYPDLEECTRKAAASSRTTHGAPEAVESCELLAQITAQLLNGVSKRDLLPSIQHPFALPSIQRMLQLDYQQLSRGEVRGSGYCIESLTAALWSFFSTDNFEDAILRATNLGEDADTTAAICGQIAGAHYGMSAIPARWRSRLAMLEHIDATAQRLFEQAQARAQQSSQGAFL